MQKKSSGIWLTSLALAATTALVSPGTTASAQPGAAPGNGEGSSNGRGPATARSAKPLSKAQVADAAASAPAAGDPIQMPASYPFQPELRIYEPNPDDASYAGDLIGFADLAPKLTELMKASDRISVQVVGQSTEGRDLYLVTLTAPETDSETAQQTAWRDKIQGDPAAAADDQALLDGYKTPIWISNNIHGNEWEGTDAAMDYVEYLATAPIEEVRPILEGNRVYFSPSLNPDGRVEGTRATALGLDANRDMITSKTPESQSFIRTAQAIQPIYAADFHGYTRVLQIEPCGPPHGSNYEYDLSIPHNYALALKVEQDVVDADIPGNTYYDRTTGEAVPVNTGNIKIPYRDTPDGWDDFPPIFTAQYAAYYGAVSSTVELPLGRTNGRQTPVTAKVNTDVAYQTMASIVDYMNTGSNAREMLANQIEVFRRGVAGQPKTSLTTENIDEVEGPEQWKPLWDVADDQEPVDLPRAYVIPMGADQRSSSDARRLVEQLLLHDIEVGTLDRATTVGGTTYPAGSFVVDMHQPLRGLANAMLDLGDDISEKVPSMYDISAWSYSYLWGADVAKVGSVTDAAIGSITPINEVSGADVFPGRGRAVTFDVAGIPDFQLLNALLEDGVGVSMLEDGSAVVGRRGAAAAITTARDLGVDLDRATRADLAALDDEGTKGLTDLTVGYVGNQDDKLSLTEVGFDDLVALSADSVDAAALEGVDVLWVGSSFDPAPASPARTAVQQWVDEGGSITGRGAAAFNSAKSFGLLSGTAVSGTRGSNGIVAVDTPADGVLAPYAQDSSFIYPATWFTGLGEDVSVEQSYDAEDPFLAGHWSPQDAGTDGPAAAAGQASAVSSEAASGAKAFVFGTTVFFRTHPKGMLSQAARALFWAGPEGEGADASKNKSRTRVQAFRAGRGGESVPVRFTIGLRVPPEAGAGMVTLTDNGRFLRRVFVERADAGRKKVTIRLSRGWHKIVGSYAGSDLVAPSKGTKWLKLK